MGGEIRRTVKPSTLKFLALLRALGLTVSSFGVSHAHTERLLCQRIIEGRQAARALSGDPERADAARLRHLVARKIAVEESGLARSDGRRDRAGGQRIGELLSGKFPRDAMPSRRRVEVCVDIFLEILEEKDPEGYRRGLYGTRQIWQEIWLEADQGRVPHLDSRAEIVMGYLPVALEQLSRYLPNIIEVPGLYPAGADGDASARLPGPPSVSLDRPLPEVPPLPEVTGSVLPPLRDPGERVGAEPGQHPSHAEDAQGTPQAEDGRHTPHGEDVQIVTVTEIGRDEVPATGLGQTHLDADERLRAARAERDQALRHARRAVLFLRITVAALTVTVIVIALLVARLATGGAAARLVQLAAPAQHAKAGEEVAFSFVPPLPRGKNWRLHVALTVVSADPISACTFTMQITAHVEADGRALPSFSSSPGQTGITQDLSLGARGSRSLRLVITRLNTEPSCVLRLDPAGSHATAPG